MTEKEQKYRAHFRNVGKHLFKNEYLPINLVKHPTEFKCYVDGEPKYGVVNHGWAARNERGIPSIEFDRDGNPKPYEGFWEARCFGCTI